jgi:hypothetical protein
MLSGKIIGWVRRSLDGDDPSLMYAEWSCTEDDDPADPRSWA